jgi:uncharacterized damage-inducible protein DinB
MRIFLSAVLLCVVASAAVAQSQEKPAASSPDKPAASSQDTTAAAQTLANPFSAFNQRAYARIKGILLRSADKMPEENYKFKPVETVRSYGQIIGHLADAQYLFCSKALGETDPALKIEETKTAKADLIAALKDAFAYCDKAYDTMTDATGMQTVKLFGGDTPKLGVLEVNNIHDMEHYGNLVTYMRIKGLVPPSSEQQSQPQPPPQKK